MKSETYEAIIYTRCTRCGHRVKQYNYFNNLPYGIDCWEEVAVEFIAKRDVILNSPDYYELARYGKSGIDELAKQYGVHAQ